MPARPPRQSGATERGVMAALTLRSPANADVLSELLCGRWQIMRCHLEKCPLNISKNTIRKDLIPNGQCLAVYKICSYGLGIRPTMPGKGAVAV